MKLKITLAALLLVSSLSTFAIDITLSPIFTVVDVVKSALGTALSPFSTTASSVAGSNEQIMKAVRSDALSFLADGESTERLNSSFNELRKIDGLQNKSEIELSKLIILSVE